MMLAVDEPSTESVREISNDIIVFHCLEPLVFAMGMLHQRFIYQQLSRTCWMKKRIDAVVHHELHHKYSFDPLKAFMFSMHKSHLVHSSVKAYETKLPSVFREVIADDYAIQQTGTELGVGQALLKLIKREPSFKKQTKFAVSFGDRVLNLRIQKILNPTYNIPFNVPMIPIVTSAILMLVLMIMLNLNY
ncbi:M56 family metallopeptidase [Bacillus sp. SL00103]